MALPNDSDVLPKGVFLSLSSDDIIEPSIGFIELLKTSREGYTWPFYQSPKESQAAIIEIENIVHNIQKELNPKDAQTILAKVSQWGGNNKKAQRNIESADSVTQTQMLEGIHKLGFEKDISLAFNQLNSIPGFGFVMATKVYRFCYPNIGAAVDRHASYFFNSLNIISEDCSIKKATQFRREWSTGEHKQSRVAAYQKNYYIRNRDEYVLKYLPLLRNIATSLNKANILFKCAATGDLKSWRPVDIEMAVFFWWAKNGLK